MDAPQRGPDIPQAQAEEPQPVIEIDKVAQSILRGTRQSQQIATWSLYILLSIAFIFIGILVTRSFSQDSTITSQQRTIATLVSRSQTEQQRIEADIAQAAAGSCGFYRIIGTLPVVTTATPAAPRTAAIGVQLVASSRQAYFSFGCPAGSIAPPSAGLKLLAHLYHIKISR